MEIKIFIQGNDVFINHGAGTLLCIGKREELQDCTSERFAAMIREAVALSNYRAIESTKGLIAN